jgi:hypothetical protein
MPKLASALRRLFAPSTRPAGPPAPRRRVTLRLESLEVRENPAFPVTGANVINVVDYGATPANNSDDDWRAIQTAVSDAINTGRMVYFPAGTYSVSKGIEGRKYKDIGGQYLPDIYTSTSTLSNLVVDKGKEGGWRNRMRLLGESRGSTTILLKDGVFTTDPSGYPAREDNPDRTDYANFRPNAVIYTGSIEAGAAGDQQNDVTGTGRDAFQHWIQGLTINTGSNNAGAVGIDYFVNNSGTIRNVSIVSGDGQGYAGLRMDRAGSYSGSIESVSVTGFRRGISATGNVENTAALNLVTLSGQTEVGIYVGQTVLAVEKLTSTNTVPAIKMSVDSGHLTIINSSLTGGAAGNRAIDNAIGAPVFAKRVTVGGYGTSYYGPYYTTGTGPDVARTGSIGELSSYGVEHVGTADDQAGSSVDFGADIPQAPSYSPPSSADWAIVGPRLAGEGDDRPAIQRAFATGKPAVFLQSGRTYQVYGNLSIPASVRLFDGLGSAVQFTGPNGRLIVSEGSSNPLIIQRLRLDLYRATGEAVNHSSSRTLVLRDLDTRDSEPSGAYTTYVAGGSAGTLFINGITAPRFNFRPGQAVYARMFETGGTVIDGASVYVLGFRSEGTGTVFTVKGGGRLLALGGKVGGNSSSATTIPAFVVDEASGSKATLSFSTQPGSGGDYTVLVDSNLDLSDNTTANTAEILFASETPGRGNGRKVALFTI